MRRMSVSGILQQGCATKNDSSESYSWVTLFPLCLLLLFLSRSMSPFLPLGRILFLLRTRPEDECELVCELVLSLSFMKFFVLASKNIVFEECTQDRRSSLTTSADCSEYWELRELEFCSNASKLDCLVLLFFNCSLYTNVYTFTTKYKSFEIKIILCCFLKFENI